MILLAPESYYQIEKIVHTDCMSNQLYSVLNGTNAGFVYVDDINPTCALIFHQGEGGFFFIGDYNNSYFVNDVNQSLEALSKDHFNGNLSFFEFSGDCKEWNQTFKTCFKARDLKHDYQRIYTTENPSVDSINLNKDYEFLPITPSLFEQGFTHTDKLTQVIERWWPSLDDYLSYQTGFVAVDSHSIVGHCLLDGFAKQRMGIGIAVNEKHREKGLASSLATLMINDIHHKGHTVYWECMNDNTPSYKLAEKNGLTLQQKYDLFWFKL